MADTKISALTAVATPAGTDEFPVNQGSVSKKETLAQILAFVQAIPPSGNFGNGIDGPATVNTSSLAKDMNYTDLTINAGQVLDAAGFRIFVNGTLTFADAGSGIDHKPAATPAGGDATSGAAGGAGAVGAVAPAGNMTAGCLGLIGKVGVRRTTTQGVTAGTSGTVAVKSIYNWPSPGAGLVGGQGVTTAGGTGAGGAAAAGATSDDTGAAGAARAWRNYPDCLWPQMSVAIAVKTAITGANLQGNDASGSSGGVSSVTTNTTSIASGGSGASGCGGGPTVVSARIVSGAGYIRSSGAAGGAAGAPFGAGTVYAAGGSSGGNGGPGGIVVLVYGTLAGGFTLAQVTAPGGAGGAHGAGLALGAGSSATDGNDGAAGRAGSVNTFQMT